ncbi:recombination protein U [Atopostipes suicloacalis DSM 15692]|uniref:Holliday junction resolvase RecU n=1 Tax=Atopostipes suicloacalis DSM 15692 TaxID=1121025 RepID=A0A1M4ZLB5_9LACT|nr:Holliday junction resolvase RecU [Atopostipes suicloacalis]SHF18745.1 recombination protein U [Atopostipes suicloacalis DSM 15692]
MSPLKIHYPNGQPYHYNKENYNSQSKEQSSNYSNRGMSLEKEINLTNKQYLDDNMAVIHKKPTPIQVVKVDYPKREAAKITEAYYRRSSTTDYNGVYKGYYLDFEAKETKNKTSFPLSNFHGHQINHMKKSVEHGGICFTILRFVTLDEIYLLSSEFLFKWWDQQYKEKGRKSIPLSAIKKENFLIEYGFNPRIPYLKIVDQFIESRK